MEISLLIKANRMKKNLDLKLHVLDSMGELAVEYA